MTEKILSLLLGILAGLLGGLIGIGGGIIIVPALIFLFKFRSHQARGTTLALMVPPIGILAAYAYYRHGYVDVKRRFLSVSDFFSDHSGSLKQPCICLIPFWKGFSASYFFSYR